MSDLAQDLKQLTARHRDGSYKTQESRVRTLLQMSRQLQDAGYGQLLKACDLEDEHVSALMDCWRQQNLSGSTVKTRASVLRWWAEKINKASMVPKDNAAFGVVANDPPAANDDTGETGDDPLSQISEDFAQASLALQECFALSRDESIHFMPSVADLGDRIKLRGAWCQGGRQREIPVRTREQRAVLDRAHALAGKGALIPEPSNFTQQARALDSAARSLGQAKVGGFRREYAHARYREITGQDCPKCGGSAGGQSSLRHEGRDRLARKAIAIELGFRSEAATVTLLGRFGR